MKSYGKSVKTIQEFEVRYAKVIRDILLLIHDDLLAEYETMAYCLCIYRIINGFTLELLVDSN